MVQENPLPNVRSRVDVGLKDLGGSALQKEREIPLVATPQPVIESVRLDGMESLEIQKGLDQSLAGGVALEDGGDVGLERRGDRRLCDPRPVEGPHDQGQRNDVVFQPGCDAVEDRRLEARLVEDRIEKQRRQHRRRDIGLLGLAPQPAPKCIGKLLRLIQRNKRQASQP